jgi:hypothetical protein
MRFWLLLLSLVRIHLCPLIQCCKMKLVDANLVLVWRRVSPILHYSPHFLPHNDLSCLTQIWEKEPNGLHIHLFFGRLDLYYGY